MSGRTSLIGLLSLALFVAPAAAGTPQRSEVPRVGFLRGTSPIPAEFEAFREGLRAFGYVEGQNIVIEQRYGNGVPGRLPALAADIVRLKVAVIVVDGVFTAQAVQAATKTIPIVFTLPGDPVGGGLVASLARPGGNMTGVSQMSTELSTQRAQLLKDAFPDVTRVAVLNNPAYVSQEVRETGAAAQWLALRLQTLEVRTPSEWTGAFAAMQRGGAQALIVLLDATFSSHREQLVQLAAKGRLPAIFPEREFVDVGGLMSYAPNIPGNFRRAAAYVDKILRGAKPGDLAVDQSTRFDLVVNLKTAKTLGRTIPESVLIRADQVIQ